MPLHEATRRRLAVGIAAGVVAAVAPALPAAAATQRPTGIVHVVTQPAYGHWQTVFEVWYNRDGSGWRMRKTGRSGETHWHADRRGIRIAVASDVGGPAGTDFVSREELVRRDEANADYLTRPPVDLVIDPLARVARGEMKVVGETAVNGEPAYELAYVDPGQGGSGRYFASRDDGALLQARTAPAGVVNIATYEVLPATSRKARRPPR